MWMNWRALMWGSRPFMEIRASNNHAPTSSLRAEDTPGCPDTPKHASLRHAKAMFPWCPHGKMGLMGGQPLARCSLKGSRPGVGMALHVIPSMWKMTGPDSDLFLALKNYLWISGCNGRGRNQLCFVIVALEFGADSLRFVFPRLPSAGREQVGRNGGSTGRRFAWTRQRRLTVWRASTRRLRDVAQVCRIYNKQGIIS